ncbi:MAG: hypothetical protein PHX60_14780 [Giesbergeria sp.]|uniref:hypothetical protein n=1 Tax=Giesbergeria sp. TaxID=2818473 RepID=UPI00260810A2|nr:hypothetical protein [Giesbergeria sp.]MDD2610919.1 hypothetical protein [Giesbergeria sp.]
MLTLLLRLLAELFCTQRPEGMAQGQQSPHAERAVAEIENRYLSEHRTKWTKPNERLIAAMRLAEYIRDRRDLKANRRQAPVTFRTSPLGQEGGKL